MNTQVLLWLDVVGSALVIGGFIVAVIRWGKRVAHAISGWIDRVGDNTMATEKLTGVVTEVSSDLREVVATLRIHGEKLEELDNRVTDLEGKLWILSVVIPHGGYGTGLSGWVWRLRHFSARRFTR